MDELIALIDGIRQGVVVISQRRKGPGSGNLWAHQTVVVDRRIAAALEVEVGAHRRPRHSTSKILSLARRGEQSPNEQADGDTDVCFHG